MKKVFPVLLVILVAGAFSCNNADSKKSGDALDVINRVATQAADSIKKITDTSFANIKDSIKSGINESAAKLKNRTEALADETKEKIKKEVKKVGNAAKAGVDAAQKELSK